MLTILLGGIIAVGIGKVLYNLGVGMSWNH